MRSVYPVLPIPEGCDLAGNYYYADIEAAHTSEDMEDFREWMRGQTLCFDSGQHVVVFARDYERWANRRSRER